jgi:hypothetical protein
MKNNEGKVTNWHMRIFLASCVRLTVGYMFLAALFANIVQNDSVLSIFYSVMALDFVENIDDHAFALAKRGFFGLSLMNATNKRHELSISVRRGLSKKAWPYRVAQIFYFANALIMIIGLAIITVDQSSGMYRCSSFTVVFDEEIWDDANVVIDNDTGETEERLLIYSWFSGSYIEDGKYGGHPRYVEQNKRDNSPFQELVGAEIVYCNEISAWVFRHDNIKTSKDGLEENECHWLLRSPQISTYDLEVAAALQWNVWLGEIKYADGFVVYCNECIDKSDCSYHGTCSPDRQCQCDDRHFGVRCEFELPCNSLVTEKGGCCGWAPDQPITLLNNTQQVGDFDRYYDRPIYIQSNLTGYPVSRNELQILSQEIIRT